MVALGNVNPTLVTECFNAFVNCVNVGANHKAVIAQGLEQHAILSAQGLLSTLSHLSGTDPTSRILEDLRQRYAKVFPTRVNFGGHHIMGAAHYWFTQSWERWPFQWNGYNPPANEHALVSHNLVNLARFEYQKRTQSAKVPRWVLRFALHSLSLDPLPPTSVIADCLSIVAIDLGCDVPHPGAMTLDERYVCPYSWGTSFLP